MNCVGVCNITSILSSSITHQPSEPILARTLMRNVDERTKDEFDGYGRREVELLRCLAPAAATAHSVSPPAFQRTPPPASLTNRQPGQREPFREHSSEYSLHLQLDVSSCSWCAVYMPRCTAGGSTQAMTAADLAPTSRKEASPQWTMTNGTHPLPFPPHESACVTKRVDLQGGQCRPERPSPRDSRGVDLLQASQVEKVNRLRSPTYHSPRDHSLQATPLHDTRRTPQPTLNPPRTTGEFGGERSSPPVPSSASPLRFPRRPHGLPCSAMGRRCCWERSARGAARGGVTAEEDCNVI